MAAAVESTAEVVGTAAEVPGANTIIGHPLFFFNNFVKQQN